MNHSIKEDQQLLFRCLSGDKTASEDLVRRFSDLVYRSVQYTLMARQVPFNRFDLEDLHHTVFLKLFDQNHKKLRQYQGKNGCSLASWIRMITVRTVLDTLRKKGVDSMGWQNKRIPLEQSPELKAERDDTGALYEKSEQRRSLREGITKLAPRDKLFVQLHFERGLSLTEIADIMNLTIGSTYTLKHRAIQRLKLHANPSTDETLRN